ncbi:DUF4190 domain-containing protein [Kribbella sandramycini]|uniref:DUF4190 domain-containing protein n=1 Tax=Kribbella sandramycini TaxID=60450 RepID=A0A7Y4P1A1_9ACTN|nr:DUF4190 domain-containing protein [Kribbella sandramycini]MBB6571116.1 hypothetical protein [Kribbella sandramycini]NOL43476.1 DUF4190 domain-containing protein [Kribbella sandramycini]
MSTPERPTDRPQQFYPVQPGFPDRPAYGVLQDHSRATVSLVLGLVALCAGIIVLAPVAWWLGNQAVREIDASPGVYNNRGMAQAGKILGIIGTVLLILGVIFLLGMIAIVVFGTV